MTYEKNLRDVKADGSALQYIKHQTPELCMAAVKQDGWALRFVKQQTPAICLAAIQKVSTSIAYINSAIPNQLDPNNPIHQHYYILGWRDEDLMKLQLKAVKEKGFNLSFIKEQTPEICISGIRNDPLSIIYVKDLESIAPYVDEAFIDDRKSACIKFDAAFEGVKCYSILKKLYKAHELTHKINQTTDINSLNNKRIKL